jgi:hypothetical protein
MGSRLELETHWRTVAATVTGASHRERDEDGQDAFAITSLDDGSVVVAVADGAGSAELAAEGSAAAVRAATEAIAHGASMPDAFEAAAASLGEDATRRATTLLVAVLRDGEVELGQVGDGFVVLKSGAGYDVAVPAPVREYLNETTFLSSSGWRDDLRTATVEGVEAVAVMTDGLQLVAIELATNTPHPGFFDPLFSWAEGDGADGMQLQEFLLSPRLAARTDDDLTLVLATRVP